MHALILIASSNAHAQSCSPPAPGQIAANGCAAIVPGGTFSTTVITTPVFLTQNGGSITATAPVTLSSTGDLSFGAQALTGATIVLNGGSVITNGAGGNKGTPALRANGAGSSITATNVALSTNGGGSYVVISENNAAITLHGGTVDAFNTAVHAAGLNTVGSGTTVGGGATITADQGLVIRATDVGAFATGGTINLDTVTITERVAAAANTSGLRADTNSALATSPGLINANNVTITMTGNASSGVLAVGGGKVVLTNSSISTTGTSGFGMSAAQIAPTFPGILPVIDATNVTVTTSGIAGHGAFAYNGAIINLNTVDIRTSGDTAYGLSSEGFLFSGPPILTVLNGTNVTVHTTGPNAYGAVTNESAFMNLTDSTISATGANAGGVFVGDTGSVTTLLRTTVTSAQFDGGRAADSGHLFVTDSSITGARHGIRSNGGTAADPNIVSVSGGVLTAVSGDAFNAHDTFSKIDVRNGTMISNGSGNLLNVISNDPATLISNVDFTTANIVASGNIIADATSIANVAITASSKITGIELNTFTTVDASSTWIMNGNSDIHSLTLAGLVDYTPPTGDSTLLASYKTLTTQNYIGQGGTLGLNTFLGDDSAPSDRLVINGGTATGNSFLRITNTTGPGALTIANGILVVDTINGGTTVPGAFSLSRPVVAGPFEYRLYRSSVDASNPQAWYLRSTLDCSLAPNASVCPPTPPGPNPPSPPIPNLRIETSLYAAIPAMALLYGRTLLDTLHERVGEEEPLTVAPLFEEREVWCKNPEKNYRCVVSLPVKQGSSGGGAAGGRYLTSSWGRIIGMRGERDGASNGIFGAGPRYSYDFFGVQIGQDIYRRQDKDGARDYAGLYVVYGEAKGRVTHFDGQRGRSDFTGYTLGAYWTHFGASGWYLDGVAQVTRYDVISTANRGLRSLNTNGVGFAASLEGGYPFRFSNGYFIEPQAQLVYQKINLNGASDGAAMVRFSDVDSLAGRIGVRLGRTWALDNGPAPRLITAWLRPNLWHEFRGDPKTEFSSATGFIPFRADLGGTWFEINAGISGQLNKNVSVYANASYETRFTGSSSAYNGKLGVRVNW
ncbi:MULTISPECIES: autotransporter outer membrane beta-barrel domain-containing protein [unclassified Beijerinckia]|uniref:autotransporter family protein n=1 Tax=unclassified Beijerinckia TaxID=2638183 RepID=UPI00147A1FD8|nr:MULTISPECIES: autotransporter outer membrane beta-barrel domain-containing protein [unclassified Beijerinckia]